MLVALKGPKKVTYMNYLMNTYPVFKLWPTTAGRGFSHIVVIQVISVILMVSYCLPMDISHTSGALLSTY